MTATRKKPKPVPGKPARDWGPWETWRMLTTILFTTIGMVSAGGLKLLAAGFGIVTTFGTRENIDALLGQDSIFAAAGLAVVAVVRFMHLYFARNDHKS